MEGRKTILSAGKAICEQLKTDERVAAITRKIFPIVDDEADMPYIAYCRSRLVAEATKARPVDTARYEVACYCEDYEQSVDLAEAVRAALDMHTFSTDGAHVRLCRLVDAKEAYIADAWAQILTFEAKN